MLISQGEQTDVGDFEGSRKSIFEAWRAQLGRCNFRGCHEDFRSLFAPFLCSPREFLIESLEGLQPFITNDRPMVHLPWEESFSAGRELRGCRSPLKDLFKAETASQGSYKSVPTEWLFSGCYPGFIIPTPRVAVRRSTLQSFRRLGFSHWTGECNLGEDPGTMYYVTHLSSWRLEMWYVYVCNASTLPVLVKLAAWQAGR